MHRHPLIDPLRSGADGLATVLTTRFASGRLRIRLWFAPGERRRLALAPAAQIIDHSLKLDDAPSQLHDPPVPLGELLTKLSYDFKQLVVTRPVHISFRHGRQEPDTVNRYPLFFIDRSLLAMHVTRRDDADPGCFRPESERHVKSPPDRGLSQRVKPGR